MNSPIYKPWISLCLPVYKEFKNLCLVSILKLVIKLQPLFDATVTKEFTDNICSVNMPPLSRTEKQYYPLHLISDYIYYKNSVD